MENRIRVGVIGTSWWADLMHLPSCKSHQGAEITAICGRNRDRAQEMALKYDIPQIYVDYKAMLMNGKIDAVIVSVPDDLHYEMSICAIDAGIHVLCEKPLAMSLKQASEMLDRAEKANIKHMTYFTNRWTPWMRYIKQLVEDNFIGKILSSEFRYISGFAFSGEYRWRTDRRHSLGVLGDFGAHAIDLSRWFVGDISSVAAHLTANINRYDEVGGPFDSANDSAMLLVEYVNGAHGTINLSNVSHIGDQGQLFRLVLHGVDGTLDLEVNMPVR